MENRETKVVALVALVISVVALSICFAALSKNLKIEANARFKSQITYLDVVFSTSSDSVTTGEVIPTGTATGTTFNILPNSQTSISDINVNFTDKGQKAEYDFFIYNNSNYIAYLTEAKIVDMTNQGTQPIVCSTSGELGAVINACKDMKYTLSTTANNTSTIIYSVTGEARDNMSATVTNISIPAHTAIPVKLTIEYVNQNESAAPNEDFNVNIGTLTLTFSTQNR